VSVLLRLEALRKTFGATVALGGVDLEVRDGEFVTLLGPSGCGKTTLLRSVAGFERPSSGRVILAGQDITNMPSHKRPVNTVFQRYLMFPHLTVFENVAFGLRVAGTPKREIGERVREALALVRLEGYEDRRADQLSGGQSQRISLARALVNRPQLLLLDEPLSALDLKVRLDMQGELRRIHRELGTTFLYVTHDQQEAMSLSDRVIVMRAGHIEQAASPEEVYHRPLTKFVAEFVGDANLLPVDVVSVNGTSSLVRLRGGAHEVRVEHRLSGDAGWLVLRPETVMLGGDGDASIDGTVRDVAFLGSMITYVIDVSGLSMRVQEAGRDVRPRYEVGDAVTVTYDPARCAILQDSDEPAAAPAAV
jgi:spermidine/putrescine transport system ATP-binding protein